MGHNLISCCHRCKVQIYHFRHEENIAILPFYKKHAGCAKEDINNVQTVMDNNGTCQEWAYDWLGKTPKYEDDSLQP